MNQFCQQYPLFAIDNEKQMRSSFVSTTINVTKAYKRKSKTKYRLGSRTISDFATNSKVPTNVELRCACATPDEQHMPCPHGGAGSLSFDQWKKIHGLPCSVGWRSPQIATSFFRVAVTDKPNVFLGDHVSTFLSYIIVHGGVFNICKIRSSLR